MIWQKAINNISGPNSLVLTFLVFRAYPCMSKFDALIPTITQCVTIIKNAIKKVQKVRTEKIVANISKQNNRSGLMVSDMPNLPLNFDVSLWQEGNARHSGK